MTIAFHCSECETPLKVTDALAGKKCKCPQCAAILVVPIRDDGGAKNKSRTGKDRKIKKGGSAKGLIIGGLIVVLGFGFFACAGTVGGFAFWYFSSGTPDELKYLPSASQEITSQRVDQMRNSAIYKDLVAVAGKEPEFDGFNNHNGIALTNVDRLVTGNTGHGLDGEKITVIHTKSAVKVSDLISKLKSADAGLEYTEVRAGKYTMNEPKAILGAGNFRQAFCVVDSKTVIFGPAKTVRNVLERDKRPVLSASMEAALKKADFSKTDVKVRDYSDGRDTPSFTDVGFWFGKAGTGRQVVSVVGEQDASSGITSRSIWTFKDASTATEAKKDWDDGFQKAKNEPLTKDFLADIQASSSVNGNVLTIEGKVSGKALTKMIGKQ